MSKVRPESRSAAEWPAWTDEECWVPTEADAQWWAEENEDWDSHPTDAEIDQWANESEALSMMERGIWPY